MGSSIMSERSRIPIPCFVLAIFLGNHFDTYGWLDSPKAWLSHNRCHLKTGSFMIRLHPALPGVDQIRAGVALVVSGHRQGNEPSQISARQSYMASFAKHSFAKCLANPGCPEETATIALA